MTRGRFRRRLLATASERLAPLPFVELGSTLRVYEARSWAARRDGLSGLPMLPEDCGLWLAPCRSIHTFGMSFSLDLVWLDGRGLVLEITRDVAPRRQRAKWTARSVIEVASGRGDAFAAAWSARPLPHAAPRLPPTA